MGGHHGIDHVLKMRYMYSSSVSSFVIGHWSLRSHVRKRTSPAQLGPLHFRSLDMDKTEALRLNKGNFDAFIQLSELSRSDFQWWVNSARSLHNPISLPQPEINLYTDAS